MIKVPVERYVEQVRHGSDYKGHIKIAETKLDYELRFAVPISRLNSMKPTNNKEDIRRTFQLTVKRDGANIKLSEEEYGFFFQMLVTLAVDFYNNPQTQDSNEGFIGIVLQGQDPFSDFAKASIGMTSVGSYDFSPELCAMLSAQKFGCALVA